MRSCFRSRYTPEQLLVAITKDKDIKTIEKIIARVTDVNLMDENGWTPLHWAIEKGRIELVKLLLAHDKIDVNSGRDGNTPLCFAAKKANFLIGEMGDDFNNSNFVYWFAFDDNKLIMKLLLAHDKLDVNIPDNLSRRPLHLLAEKGNIDIIKLFLAHTDIDINAEDKNGNTALCYAAPYNYAATIKLLVANGADATKLTDAQVKRLAKPISDGTAIRRAFVSSVSLIKSLFELERAGVDLFSINIAKGNQGFKYLYDADDGGASMSTKPLSELTRSELKKLEGDIERKVLLLHQDPNSVTAIDSRASTFVDRMEKGGLYDRKFNTLGS